MPKRTGNPMYYTDKKSDESTVPPLVLVHGAGGSHLDWSPELRRLSGVRVIAVDLSGHGRSAGSGYDDTLAYAHDVAALLTGLEISRAVIAGHSMGGAVAQQLGLNFSAQVAGLILVGTGSKLPVDPTLPDRIISQTEQAVDWIVDWSWGVHAPAAMKARSRENLLKTAPEVMRNDYLACMAFDFRDKLEQITAPTLVLAAVDDQMVKLKFGITLAERIPNAKLVQVEGAGHMFPLEQAGMVAQAIETWLKEQQWTG